MIDSIDRLINLTTKAGFSFVFIFYKSFFFAAFLGIIFLFFLD